MNLRRTALLLLNGAAFSPLDISGLRLWLKADAGVYTDAGGATPAAVDGDVVGCWKDQSGNGYDVIQDTTSKKPLWKLGVNGIHGRATLLFDGIDDLLLRTTANWLSTDSAGSVFVVTRFSAGFNSSMAYLASFDAVTSAQYGVMFSTFTSTDHRMRMWHNNNLPIDDVLGNTALVDGNAYVLAWRSSGSAYTMRVDGVDQTLTVAGGSNAGNWFAEAPNRDHVSIGAHKFTVEGSYVKGSISEILVYNTHLTGSDLARVESYLNRRYAAS